MHRPSIALTVGLLWIFFLDFAPGEPSFFRQPENVSATETSTVLLRCVIENKGAGVVQWTQNGFGLGSLQWYPRYSMIGSAPENIGPDRIEEFSLRIENLNLTDDASYMCQIMGTDTHQPLVSRSAFVTVLVPPSQPVLQGKVTIPVILDTPTNITCFVANGKPKPQVLWKKDSIRITENVYEQVMTTNPDDKRVNITGIVTITAQASDAGRSIECGAWNEALQGEEPYWTQATLDVRYAPKVRMSHSQPDKTMREFDDVKFTCTERANPYEVEWWWYKDGDWLPDESRNIYEIPRLPRGYHGSVIACEANNTVGSTRVEHSMNILYGPEFRGVAKHVSSHINGRAEMVCQADGNPTAEITWRRKGKYTALHMSSTYVIPNVRESSFGVYTCTATVLGFNEISRDIYLTQNAVPEIVSDETQYASVGETARLMCMTISSPKPDNIIWTRGGLPIDYANSGRFSAPEEDLPYGRKSILQILEVEKGDFGVYNCSVKNSEGRAEKLFTLEEKEVLPVAIIAGAGAGAVAVILVIVLACVIYHRCKHSDNESYAETDSNTEIKKRDKNESPSELTKSTLMDQWRQDYNYRYSADCDETDSKANNNGVYGNFVAEPYATVPRENGNIYIEHPPITEDVATLNRFDNSYSTGYIPSTFRSQSRTDFSSGRTSTTDFSGRVSTDPHEPYRLPAADYSTAKLATNV